METWSKEDTMGENDAPVVGMSEGDDSLAVYVRQISKYPLLSHEEEFELARRSHDLQDEEAVEKLINSNLRFVVRVALQYRFSGAKVLDLIQEGNLGLIMAVKKFNPHKGCRLITYAVWWIRAYIQNFVMKTWSVVRIGTTQTQRKLFYKMGAIGKTVQSDHDNENRYELLASELDVTRDDLVEMRERVTHRDVSLDCPFDGDDDLAPLDLLRSTFSDQEEVVSREEERTLRTTEVENALKTLTVREAYVVKNRTMAIEPRTLQDIGLHLKVSRERVRQIEFRALKKLKSALQQERFSEDGRIVALARTQKGSPHPHPTSERGWSFHLRTA
jgi:RNA polymerase sigma-32 factor